MRAKAGDWLVVKGCSVDMPEQRGRILEVRSDDGRPPYVVRWLSDDHVSTVFPGADAIVLTEAELVAEDERHRARFDAVQKEISGKRVQPAEG